MARVEVAGITYDEYVTAAEISWACIVPDCGQPHHGRGLCKLHYDRWKRTGSVHLGKRANKMIRLVPQEALEKPE